MSALEALRGALPDTARDLGLNLQMVLGEGALSAAQRWGVAVACAIATREPRLRGAVLADAREAVPSAVIEDAQAVAALMAMNNVYYRFRHMVQKPSYSQRPARLRMNRLAQPAASKVDMELFALAVSAINGCEACVRAHEKVALEGGLSEDHVHDAIRIAATLQGVAIGLHGAEP